MRKTTENITENEMFSMLTWLAWAEVDTACAVRK